MANLKNKILQLLKRNNVDSALADLSKCQDNLLKNYDNPVFCNKDKNKILKYYSDLQEIGKSLYQYNTLKENNLNTEKEETNINNTILKGGISYNKYVWHSEKGEHTCDVCKSLDGKVFDFYDEVPERPHPNCRCTVEVVESDRPKADVETPQKENDNKDKVPSQSIEVQPEQNWILPVSKGHKITSGYGYRMHPVYHTQKLHDGIDINAIANTPVYAVADGKVSVSGWINGYGNYIQIEHSNGLASFYAHLNKINVNKGSIVKQGQNIGLSGNTGIGTGPHLHFGAKKAGVSINPLIYLPSF